MRHPRRRVDDTGGRRRERRAGKSGPAGSPSSRKKLEQFSFPERTFKRL